MSYGRGGSDDPDDPSHFEQFREGVDHAIVALTLRYGRRHIPEFLLGGVAGVVSRALDLLPALLLAVAIDSLFFDTRAFGLPGVPPAWLPTDRFDQLVLLVALVGTIYVVQAVLNWVNSWAWNHYAQHLQHEVRTETYDAMQALEMEFFDDKQTGEVMSILNNDVNQLENFLTSNLNTGIRIAVAIFGTLIVMLLVNWQLAIVSLTAVPVLGLASVGFVRVIAPKYRRVRRSVGALNSRLENNLSGIEVLKAFTTEDYESERIDAASREYLDANWSAISTRIKFWPTLQLVTGFGYLLTLAVGGYWVMFGPPGPFTGTLTAGVLVMFLTYTRQFMFPMMQFGQILNSYSYAEAASQRILGLIEEPRTIADTPDAVALDTVAGGVTYDDVSFRYEADTDPILEDVTFDIQAGEFVGLVGPTGSGKTTLVKLLLRFYEVDEGAVRVDGHDIRELSLASLRASIGYVSQEPYLFYGTIRENIAYGVTDPDTPAIEDAARRAGAHGFIEELPDGYDTMVGERGVKLSGGQRQRVSIARAILRDPAILILDEATSHVDNETEILIQRNLEELIADRTTIAIAHRLSTVRRADRILVLDDGELIESGTHETLLERDGLYANLWRVQVGEVSDLPEAFVRRAAERRSIPRDGAFPAERASPPRDGG